MATIRLDPKGKYPLTREVLRAVMDEFLEQETRKARTLEDRRIIDEVRDEWSDPERWERYYRIWVEMCTPKTR